MNKTIFDLSDEILQLDELLDTLGDESNSQIVVLDRYLTTLRGKLEDKIDGFCDYIRELEARSEVRKAEAERILHLSKVDANKAERLKKSLQWFFFTHDMQICQTPKHKMSLCTNGGVQPISINVPVEEIPAEYVREITTYKPDMELIREKLQAGEELPFAMLEERRQSIRIA